jgi:hypothetical protein
MSDHEAAIRMREVEYRRFAAGLPRHAKLDGCDQCGGSGRPPVTVVL